MKRLLFIGLTSLLMIGCAGGPKASFEEDMKAKQFVSPSNSTSTESFAGAINMDILNDDKRIATTGPKSYILKNLPAGEHKIEGIATKGTSIIRVNLLPNTLKFV